jgi:hypothetical protein
MVWPDFGGYSHCRRFFPHGNRETNRIYKYLRQCVQTVEIAPQWCKVKSYTPVSDNPIHLYYCAKHDEVPILQKGTVMKSRQKSSKQSSGSGTRQSADQGSRSGAQPSSQQSDSGRQSKTDKKTPASRSGNR